MYPTTESDRSRNVDDLLLTTIFVTVFVRRAPVKDSIASAMYSCKILYDANMYGCDAICE